VILKVGGDSRYREVAEKRPGNRHRRAVAASLVRPWGREKEERIRERKWLEVCLVQMKLRQK